MGDPVNLIITVFRATGLSVKSILKRKPNAFVQLQWAGNVRRTRTVKASLEPSWEESFALHSLRPDTVLTFELVDKGFGPQHSLGKVQITVTELIERDGNGSEIELTLSGASIFVSSRKETLAAIATDALLDARGFDRKLADPLPKRDILETFPSQHFAEVVKSLSKLMEALDSFSKVHPYVHAAWKTVTLVYRVVDKQLDRDEDVRELLSTMDNLYTFVYPLESLSDKREKLHPSLEEIVTKILKQTIECVLFIQEYSGHGFAAKAVLHTVSTADSQISLFKASFIELGASLDTGLGLQTALVSLRISQGVQQLVTHNTLDPVKYDWSSRPTCHPRTCLDMFRLVTDWVVDASASSNVLWLSGLAGAGKSTLSTTIANFYAETRRLGAFIFFDRDVKERSDPANVVRTLAFELSRFDERIARGVETAIAQNPHIAQMQLDAQFRELVKQALDGAESLAQEGPIVIVLDALDECGTLEDRKRLLSLLAKETANLPLAFRIIVTSRDETDIANAFNGEPHVKHMPLEVYPGNGDIEIFMRQQLAEIADKNYFDDDWPGDESVAKLVKRAAGLFIWASTACKYIDVYEPEIALEELLNSYNNTLDDLYVKALASAGDWKNARFKKDCVSILGLIVVVKNPVSPNAIDNLLRVRSIRAVSRLGSVLRYQSPSDPVRILHASFRDYISSPDVCGNRPWFIDLDVHEAQLATSCLAVLKETFAKPSEIVALDEKVDIKLDEAVMYACTYWVTHACGVKRNASGLVPAVREFMRQHLIRWFEVMSAVGKSRTTPKLLEQLHAWVKLSVPDDQDLTQLAYDAYRFAGFFADSIAEHPRLVTLAALPFAPLESKIYELYHNEDSMPTVLGGYQKQWSPSLRVLQRLDTSLLSVAFSPDGSKIVSCGAEPDPHSDYWDTDESITIRSWDVTTGLEAIPPISVQAYAIMRFSPDGSMIWSADALGSMSIFDAGTGDVRRKFDFFEWADKSSIMFQPETASPGELVHAKSMDAGIPTHDGSLSAILEGTAKALEVHSRSAISETFLDAAKAEHDSDSEADAPRAEPPTRKSTTFGSLDPEEQPQPAPPYFTRAAFSPDGRYVAFCTDDVHLFVLDTEEGKQAFPVWRCQRMSDREVVRIFPSIEISTQNVIGIAGGGGTLYLLDAATGSVLHQLPGHSSEVTVVSFSKDGRQLYSGSEDGVICTSDVDTGVRHVRTRCIHVSCVGDFQPLAISSDGRVASTSADGTVQIWDISSGKEVGPLLQGHFNAVSAMRFADDSTKLVSGAFLNNIQIWDTHLLSGKLNPRIQRHDRPPHEVAFSPDCLHIRSARPDETKIWNSITGKELQMKPHHKNAVFSKETVTGDIVLVSKENGIVEFIELVEEESERGISPEDHERWATRLRAAHGSPTELICDRGMMLLGDSQIWRLPLEFRYRSHHHRGRFVAFGIWNGRVFVVHLPSSML